MMDPVRIGVGFGSWRFGVPSSKIAMEIPERVEALGIDSIWLADHVLPPRPDLETMTLLSIYTAKTRRIKLGTSILLLPLRNPILVAKAIATLDYLSDGRMVLGLGVGGENPKEFSACGVPLSERKSRIEEGITILKKLWTESNVTFSGKHYQFNDVTLEPKPKQKPHPSIWIGGKSPAALKRVAAMGDGWFASFITPEAYRKNMADILSWARESGRNVNEIESGVNLMSYVGDSSRAAVMKQRFLNDFAPFGADDRSAAFGTVKDCIVRIEEYLAAGTRLSLIHI